MTMQAVRTILFNNSANQARGYLGSFVSADDLQKASAVSDVNLDTALDKDYEIVPSQNGTVLKLSKSRFGELLKLVNSPENTDSVREKQDYFTDLTAYENRINKALNNTRDFLKRALNRTTGMFSRLLKFVVNSTGYSIGSDIDQSFSKIEKETFNDSSFIKSFARYFFKSGNKNQSGMTGSIFDNNEKKNNLAKLCSGLMRFAGKLPDVVVDSFPLVFCFQNIATPFLARGFKNTVIGKFFGFMRIVNPWIDEFASSVMGIFKQEILSTRAALSEIKDIDTGLNAKTRFSEASCGNNQESEEITSFKLSNLSKEQYGLKNSLDDLNSALTRLIGKKNNISSLIIFGILRFYKFKDFPDFAEKTLKRPDFIQKLHECLVEAKALGQNSDLPSHTLINTKIDKKFADSKLDRQAAKAAVALITLSHSMKDDYVKKYPKLFGNIYSWQYLFMPLVTKFVGDKGFIGKILNFITDINPLLNDFCFDPLATFQEEIIGMREKSKGIKELLPKMPELKLGSTFQNFADSTRSLVDAVYGFGKELYEKATAQVPGEVPSATEVKPELQGVGT